MKITKIILFIATAALLASAIYQMNGTLAVPPHVIQSFATWSAKHNKHYGSPAEKIYRLAVFYNNYKIVKAHNESNDTFTMELNHFADMTQEEFKTKMLGYRFDNRPRNYVSLNNNVMQAAGIDWREKGAVTPVKNQGQCGSCWAFSTIASTEGAWFQAKGKLISLSEQQLVDCSTSYGNHGCNGGLMDYGFKYIKDHGIDTETNYPYTARDGRCKRSGQYTPAATISGFSDVQQSGEALANANNQRVVSVAVDAQRWSFYSGGIYSHKKCGTQLDHGVTLVGYGTENGESYWIIKNSWSASWGEKGYIRLEKSSHNTCGIWLAASYPTV